MVVITPSMAENFRNNIQVFKEWYSSLCSELPFIDSFVRFSFPLFIIYFCFTVIRRVFDLNKE